MTTDREPRAQAERDRREKAALVVRLQCMPNAALLEYVLTLAQVPVRSFLTERAFDMARQELQSRLAIAGWFGRSA